MRIDEVPGIKTWIHHDTRVRVVAPVEQELTGIAILGSGATPEEGGVGELVFVGQGKRQDMPPRSSDAIALYDLGYAAQTILRMLHKANTYIATP